MKTKIVALVALLTIALALPAPASGAGPARWYRIQLDHRALQSDVDGIDRAGLTGLNYAPTNAYVAYGTSEEADAVRRLSSVGAVRPVRAAEKIGLRSTGGGRIGVSIASAAEGGSLRSFVGGLGRFGGSFDLRGDGQVTVTEAIVAPATVVRIAARPDVLSITPTGIRWELEDEGATQVQAGNTVNKVPQPGYEAWLQQLGIDGSGITVSVVDDGIDERHPDFGTRMKQRFDYGAGAAGPPEGHGTHVAGIIGGDPANLPGIGRVKDSAGLLYGMGVAPKVSLVDQPAIKLANSMINFPPTGGFQVYTRDALSAGASIWNASWTDGGGTGVGYVANAASLDALTRDADPASGEAEEFTFVFSAGNSGSAASTVTSPKEAKNIITVASSVGHRAGNVDSISNFSSRGPARDGRVVPTIAAPGQTIISARASTGVLCTAPLSGPADAPPPDGFGLYTGCSGTSMASPHVAGAVALIHDWWGDRNAGDRPSPAMSKALLVNSAQDMGAKDIPNRNEGWGRVNLGRLFDPATERVYLDQTITLSSLDEARTFRVEVIDPTQPFRVTLAWTDAPGTPVGAGAELADPALLNDLDLRVTAPQGDYWGNWFQSGSTAVGGTEDRINNVENVFLPTGSGVFDVVVSASNLPGDGVPGAGDQTDQDFALVISNARIVTP